MGVMFMGSRYTGSIKRGKSCGASEDNLIERVKKMRALNRDPSDVGLDSYAWKRASLNRSNIDARSI